MLAALGKVMQKPILKKSCFSEAVSIGSKGSICFPVVHIHNFWKSSKMEDWGAWLCLSSNVRRPRGTKHCCDVGRTEPAVSPLSEVGNKARVVPILQVRVCAPLLESLHWLRKGVLDRSKKLLSTKIILIFLQTLALTLTFW